jgi:ssDNA-binding Zn-finger/Zn-ribbon topoisomerase 1
MTLGRLKHSLKERCPECGKVLQLRVIDVKTMNNGIEVIVPKEYIACSNRNCDYEREVEQKRRRRQEDDLTL